MVGKLLAVGIGLLSIVAVPSAGNAMASPATDPADAGDAVVVDPVNVSRRLSEGDSTSAFTFQLPSGAACPGDSANDDWRVQSFLVPADTDIGSLGYRASRPDGEDYRSLRYLSGDIFAMELTNQNPGPGQPGVIRALPPMTLAWFPAGSLEPGTYKMGIACTEPGWQVERYWDVTVELESAPDVDPGGLRWRVVTASGTAGSAGSSGSNGFSPVLFGAVAVLVVGGVVLIRRRNRRNIPPHQHLKESV